MILVINEWIFDDLNGANGPDRFKETARFVLRLNSSGDTVVMPVEQRWRDKASRARTAADPMHREAGRLFVDLFWDLSRSIVLNPDDIPQAPEREYDWAPEEDVYLIEAYVATKADLLVTTDETLFDKIVEHGRFACRLRDEFLSTYGTGG